jgi:hypothetical protein
VTRLRSRYDRQLLWLRKLLTPGEYRGLYFTLGLLTAAGCLWLFGRLAEDIVGNDPLVSFDQTAATAIHELRTPPLTTFFLVVTALGSIEAIALVSLVGAVVFRRVAAVAAILDVAHRRGWQRDAPPTTQGPLRST